MNHQWLDERIRLGEVPAGSEAKADARLNSPEGRAEQDRIALSDASILERLPPERMAGRIRGRVAAARTEPQAPSWLGTLVGSRIPVYAAAVALLLGAVLLSPRILDTLLDPDPAPVARRIEPAPVPGATTADPPAPAQAAEERGRAPVQVAAADAPDDGIRLRGAGSMELLVVAPDGTTKPAGDSAAVGSVLRVVAPRAANAAVWSIDETGNIQRHWPIEGDSSASLPAGPLPRDWETDPSAGWERFVLVQGPEPFPLKDAESHLRGLVASRHARDGRVSMPRRLGCSSVLVERVAR